MRLSSYPETASRAEEAYAAALRPRRPSALAWPQKQFYAFHYNGIRNWFERHPDRIAVAWNGLNGLRRIFMDAARDAGARTLYFELAPFKGRITCDPVGVNQANGLPRTAEFYLDWMTRSTAQADEWRRYRTNIAQRVPAHAKPDGTAQAKPAGPYLFAPLQVPGDSQLRLFGGRFRTVPDFIEALICAAEALPEGWHLKIKEHPTSPISFADRLVGRSQRVILDNRSDTFALVDGSAGVVTVNSSVGLEAMFFDKPVVACGECFWAIPGVAETASDPAALAAAFTQPEAWSFSSVARGAFLTYLLDEYYVSTDGTSAEGEKIRRRLVRDNWP
ncbi:capsular biosynthesis protein [Tabrizicola sp.]|uniref:capsular polysaccharide export protein, LipB/KpsS family n=1 Tax=Tabrizicola sp. TaxID=2005166 RepID=UPI002735A1DB|nr:capsular biosynthesis protein [Tabrizicola sp.]MDP3194849.1 capsular biosynthesis protein [Tabrizicola sp.]